jgi:serine/threonine-protein kinase BUR1
MGDKNDSDSISAMRSNFANSAPSIAASISSSMGTSKGAVLSGGEKRGPRVFKGVSPFEDYDVLNKVGEGTFGEVYKARRKKDDMIVALKRILTAEHKDGFPITSLREIRILKSLDHINIVPLLDMAISNMKHPEDPKYGIYMVFPFMDHDLVGLLDAPDIRFTSAQVKCYIQQLLRGIEYMHSHGYMHRDIKSANILINNRGILKIADFGLARPLYPQDIPSAQKPEKEHQNIGRYTSGVVTRWYRSPELLFGTNAYDSSVDMWSIGCILAELMLHRPIFPGISDLNQIEMIASICGTPNSETMPDFTSYPDSGKIQLKKCPRILATYLQEHCSNEHLKNDKLLIQLIDGFLQLDPKKRLGANEALKHVYFEVHPLPSNPSDLPIYSKSYHEMGKRQRDKEKRDSAALTDIRKIPPPPPPPIVKHMQYQRYNQSHSQNHEPYATLSRPTSRIAVSQGASSSSSTGTQYDYNERHGTRSADNHHPKSTNSSNAINADSGSMEEKETGELSPPKGSYYRSSKNSYNPSDLKRHRIGW